MCTIIYDASQSLQFSLATLIDHPRKNQEYTLLIDMSNSRASDPSRLVYAFAICRHDADSDVEREFKHHQIVKRNVMFK